MNFTEVFLAASVVLLAIGAVIWIWLIMAQVEDDLRASSGFKGLQFEV